MIDSIVKLIKREGPLTVDEVMWHFEENAGIVPHKETVCNSMKGTPRLTVDEKGRYHLTEDYDKPGRSVPRRG